jgi:UDPglucose 6-dehydrogenase
MKISIFGTGYVGLVSGVCFAHLGNDVICIDRNPTKIRTLNKGISTIYEPELDNMLGDVVNNGKFKVTADAEDAILKTDITFICVGTPSNEDGSTDLTSIFEAAEQIGKVLAKKNTHHIIVVKSTVPPGTTEKVDMTLQMSGANNYGIAMNPEFLREGHAVQDFLYPDRIVIGCNKHETSDKLRELYSFTLSPGPLLVTEIKVAEMIKYTSNAMLATKISFSNEIGNICKKLGIDVYDVMIGVGADKRIGPQFLNAGVGFGGSCFPKDVKSLIHTAKVNDVEPKILQAVMDTNELQP